jgi:hypothetical protein
VVCFLWDEFLRKSNIARLNQRSAASSSRKRNAAPSLSKATSVESAAATYVTSGLHSHEQLQALADLLTRESVTMPLYSFFKLLLTALGRLGQFELFMDQLEDGCKKQIDFDDILPQ